MSESALCFLVAAMEGRPLLYGLVRR